MVAVLQEILVMPNTPTSLIGLLVEKLIGILRDDAQKIQMVSPCGNIILFFFFLNHLFVAAWDCQCSLLRWSMFFSLAVSTLKLT